MENRILSLEKGAMERWRQGDPMGWGEISADEITYIDPGLTKPIEGIEEYTNYMKDLEGQIYYQVSEFIDPKVQVHGDAAVLTYRFFSTCLNPDGSIQSRTPWNCTEVFAKIDGKWKIVHTHWSYINGQPME